MNITNWSKAIETLSEKMPDPVTIIKASEHTLRMFSLHACAFDRETCKDDLTKGIRGYYWGLTFMVDPSLKHGVFAYYDEEAPKGTLDFTTCADGVFSPFIPAADPTIVEISFRGMAIEDATKAVCNNRCRVTVGGQVVGGLEAIEIDTHAEQVVVHGVIRATDLADRGALQTIKAAFPAIIISVME